MGDLSPLAATMLHRIGKRPGQLTWSELHDIADSTGEAALLELRGLGYIRGGFDALLSLTRGGWSVYHELEGIELKRATPRPRPQDGPARDTTVVDKVGRGTRVRVSPLTVPPPMPRPPPHSPPAPQPPLPRARPTRVAAAPTRREPAPPPAPVPHLPPNTEDPMPSITERVHEYLLDHPDSRPIDISRALGGVQVANSLARLVRGGRAKKHRTRPLYSHCEGASPSARAPARPSRKKHAKVKSDPQVRKFIEAHPGCSGAEIMAGTGRGRTTVYAAIERLILGHYIRRDGTRYNSTAVPAPGPQSNRSQGEPEAEFPPFSPATAHPDCLPPKVEVVPKPQAGELVELAPPVSSSTEGVRWVDKAMRLMGSIGKMPRILAVIDQRGGGAQLTLPMWHGMFHQMVACADAEEARELAKAMLTVRGLTVPEWQGAS